MKVTLSNVTHHFNPDYLQMPRKQRILQKNIPTIVRHESHLEIKWYVGKELLPEKQHLLSNLNYPTILPQVTILFLT
jgi:hypothetical protein